LRVRARVRAQGGGVAIDAGAAKKGKGKGKDKDKGKSAAEVTLSGNKLLLIDFDAKLHVLARNLKRRKQLFVNRMRDYHSQVEAVNATLSVQREIERARLEFSADSGRRNSLSVRRESVTEGGVTDLEAEQPDMHEMLMPKLPRFRMLATSEELHELIVESLLGTAEKIAQGRPVDANSSIQKAKRTVHHEAEARRKSMVATGAPDGGAQ